MEWKPSDFKKTIGLEAQFWELHSIEQTWNFALIIEKGKKKRNNQSKPSTTDEF